FIGTHDECDRWLETNNKSKHIAKGRGTTVSLKDRPKQNIDGSETPPRCENDELNMDDTLHDLDDETLRTVFCGIISSSQKKNNARHSDYGQ
ncbi:MAG: hypothetical protein GX846_02790, partial [Deltaproteobacteria bacterium]|nr:hypothetical protein [Deltaproteobacteria bacterium]